MPRPNLEQVLGPYRYEQTGPDAYYPLYSSHNYRIFKRTWGGVQTPSYRALKKRKLLPDNPYNSNVQTCSAGSTFETLTRQGYGTKSLVVHHTGDTPFDGIFPSLVDDANNKAILKLYKKVDGVKLNVAQFLAERKQTAELLASTALRVLEAARALRRADRRGFADALSLSGTENRTWLQSWRQVERTPPRLRISSHWLEYVYGWRPLIQDCYDAAELLAEQLNTYEGPEGEIRTAAKVQSRFTLRGPVPTGSEGGVILQNRDDFHACTSRIRVQYRLDDEARSLLNKTGISNPALLAWELLPWSFVVDWFVPVGTYLESLTAMDGFTLTRGTLSTLESAVSDRWITFKLHTGTASAYGWDFVKAESTGPKVSCEQSRYTRTPTTAFSYALKVRNPIGGEPATRFATAAALISGLFGRKPTPLPPRERSFRVNTSWSDVRYLRGDNNPRP